MSMGMLTGDDAPAILRGPMVTKYLRMFVSGVAWGKLDYLILDLPPGTGDTQLTLAQGTPLSGAVIVTTPQDVSLNIARRGLRMFEKVQVPILGVIENMSSFACPHCGKNTDIFRQGGGQRMSQELGVPFLGAIPLDADVVIKAGRSWRASLNLRSLRPTGRSPSTCVLNWTRRIALSCGPSSGTGSLTRARRVGTNRQSVPPMRKRLRSALPSAIREPYRCCGRTAAAMTSTCEICASPARVRCASRR